MDKLEELLKGARQRIKKAFEEEAREMAEGEPKPTYWGVTSTSCENPGYLWIADQYFNIIEAVSPVFEGGHYTDEVKKILDDYSEKGLDTSLNNIRTDSSPEEAFFHICVKEEIWKRNPK